MERNLGDLGYVKLIHSCPEFTSVEDGMSNIDRTIVQSARISFDGGNKPRKNDKSLLRRLVRHYHTSPLEMAMIKFEIKAPIFVRTHFIRHRTGKINELSQRFKEVEATGYVPTFRGQSSHNKQVSTYDGDNRVPKVENHITESKSLYKSLLEEGLSREQSRVVLPLTTHTKFVWFMDLHNLLKFISLRDSDDAQYETRLFAQAIKSIVKELCPALLDAYDSYWNPNYTIRLSREDLKNLTLTPVDNPSFPNKTELREFTEKVNKANSVK